MTEKEVDHYLASVPEPQRSTQISLLTTIASLLPEAEQGISYGIPTFKIKGKGIAGFGHQQNHCSYFPMSGSITAELAQELAAYATSKGAVQFPIDEPLPPDLVQKLIDARRAELERTGR